MVVTDTATGPDGYRIFTCNTVTGRVNGVDLQPVGAGYGLRLNDAGQISMKIRPLSADYATVNIRNVTEPVFQSLGVAYQGRILECGPIWEADFDDGTGEMELTAAGLWSIFDHRKAVPGAALLQGASVPKAKITIAGTTLAGIARELVRISIEDNPYGVGGLNIVLPDITETGTATRTYNGFDLAWIGDRLRELTKVEGGPDIRFRPRFSGADPTVVEWVMEVGSQADPLLRQTGADWIWDGTAQDSGVVGFAHKRDATGMADKAYAPGSGQDVSMFLATTTGTGVSDAGGPWLEIDESSKDTENLDDLQAYANQLWDGAQQPLSTFTVKVQAYTAPLVGEYLPGEYAQVIIPDNHPTLEPGPQRVRIMAVDGDGTNTVSITVAPLQVDGTSSQAAGTTTVNSDQAGDIAGAWTDQPAGTWAPLPVGTWEEEP